MSRKKVLVLGGNFGGLTAALAVSRELHSDVDVRVISASDRFLFNPSLIWLPFGKRRPADITFPLAPTFESHGIEFVHAEATAIDLASQKVMATSGAYSHDCLVIAAGYRNNFGVVPGLGPDGNAYTITTMEDAIHAGEGWRRFLENPETSWWALARAPGASARVLPAAQGWPEQAGEADLHVAGAVPRPLRHRRAAAPPARRRQPDDGQARERNSRSS